MNTEEKAKAYDETISKLQSLITNANKQGHIIIRVEDIENTFPELCESEDDRIRKAIYNALKYLEWNLSWDFLDDVDILDAYEWLEKQGTSYTKKDVDDAYLKGISDAKNEIEKQYEANYQIRKDIATFIFNYRGDLKDRAKWMDYLGIKVSFVKEQGEQNPVNTQSSLKPKSALEAAKEKKIDTQNCVNPTSNHEPEFREGDFIVNDYCRGKIIALTSDAYLLDTGQGIPFSCEDNVRLWTIQDAKDGDVLCCESGWTCIFKELNSDMSFSSYCFMDDTGWFCETGSESHTLDKAFIKACNGNIYPATKEQRDALFTKIKEAGYEWDAEKKELKIVDWSKHIKYNPNAPSITEEKSTRSKEDEKILQWIISDIEKLFSLDKKSPIISNIEIDWLKSLKERIGE